LNSIVASFLPTLTSVGAAVVVLGVLVFVHEFGHFITAKLLGVGVLKFSLGFGKKLIGWKRGETEYMISAFPLGGYVKMIGEDDNGEGGENPLSEEDKARSFAAQPLRKKAMIVVAGPLFNIILAFLICWMLFLTGFPTAIAKVRAVEPGSPAAAAGFQAGDIVEKADGEGMDVWQQVADYVTQHPGKKIDFEVRRAGNITKVAATPLNIEGKGRLGLSGSAIIEAMVKGSPADKAGMMDKDRVIAVDGRPISAWGEMADIIKSSGGKELNFTILRAGQAIELKATPEMKTDKTGKQTAVIGIQMGSDVETVAYNPIEAARFGFDRTVFLTEMTVGLLARLVGGKEDASSLGGPIAIVQLSGRQARQGLTDYLLFMALLSVNLGVINLFPVPILDGGHLLFFGMEAVMGRPLSMRKREILQQIGLFILVSLMIFVFLNDIKRLLGLSVMWK